MQNHADVAVGCAKSTAAAGVSIGSRAGAAPETAPETGDTRPGTPEYSRGNARKDRGLRSLLRDPPVPGVPEAHERLAWTNQAHLEAESPAPPLRPCDRCGRSHRGLCAQQTLGDYRALAALGIPASQADQHTRAKLRQRAIQWVHGIVTESGRDRALAVATCGRFVVARRAGKVGLASPFCRDRACPRCQQKRARELAGDLRWVWNDRRERKGISGWFVTLTQPKPHGTDPRIAVDRAMAAWRELTNPNKVTGRKFGLIFPGAVRALEVTWSPKGQPIKGGGEVAYTGWHAHFHVILEGGTNAELRWLRDRWLEITGGSERAFCARRVDDRAFGELSKYVVKPMTTVPCELGRSLFECIHSRRLFEGLGSWKGWRNDVEREPGEVIHFSDTTPSELVRLAKINPTAPIAFYEYDPDMGVARQCGSIPAHEAVSSVRAHGILQREIEEDEEARNVAFRVFRWARAKPPPSMAELEHRRASCNDHLSFWGSSAPSLSGGGGNDPSDRSPRL